MPKTNYKYRIEYIKEFPEEDIREFKIKDKVRTLNGKEGIVVEVKKRWIRILIDKKYCECFFKSDLIKI